MGTYRCQGCREWFRRPEYQRVGLGAVCSPGCFTTVRSRRPAPKVVARPVAGDDVPADVRTAVYLRDRHRCRYCGATAPVELHHITYRSEGVDHSPHNLVTLCPTHHALMHTDKRRWQPVLRAYIWMAYVEGTTNWVVDIERRLCSTGAHASQDGGDVRP